MSYYLTQSPWQELGSHSHSAMSSSGKAAIASSCLSFECFDTLTKSCIKCSELYKDNTTLPLLTLLASHPTAEPTLAPTLTSTFLIFGVPVAVVFILILVALCGFLACKVGKWRRKRKAADEEAKANMDTASPLPSKDPAMPEGDGALDPELCSHLDGGLKMLGPPEKARAKRRPCCQGNADGDIILLSTVYPRHEECNHSFPLPATELGATALVTTKTTQNCAREERV
ncbi:PREDICTED: tumor necrosis factor receptor superfamily member 13C-like [Lepidothrix coronata]|uniref:Tumor necrosis factor receptor superfamily member 13C-like n=1 Tax=Lepidothrix coronata TaxID=321398 RepID=A0A6J0I8V3_9PASS|nr:PREDICTED: tumor necrosis factor receptor superfamily member 13C-like [Lepidothrix coronata]